MSDATTSGEHGVIDAGDLPPAPLLFTDAAAV